MCGAYAEASARRPLHTQRIVQLTVARCHAARTTQLLAEVLGEGPPASHAAAPEPRAAGRATGAATRRAPHGTRSRPGCPSASRSVCAARAACVQPSTRDSMVDCPRLRVLAVDLQQKAQREYSRGRARGRSSAGARASLARFALRTLRTSIMPRSIDILEHLGQPVWP